MGTWSSGSPSSPLPTSRHGSRRASGLRCQVRRQSPPVQYSGAVQWGSAVGEHSGAVQWGSTMGQCKPPVQRGSTVGQYDGAVHKGADFRGINGRWETLHCVVRYESHDSCLMSDAGCAATSDVTAPICDCPRLGLHPTHRSVGADRKKAPQPEAARHVPP
jgi:hypothetical protein